jgi:hypothetical protein
VTVDFPCLDCGEHLRVEIQDGKILKGEAKSYMAYVAVPFGKWREDMGHA